VAFILISLLVIILLSLIFVISINKGLYPLEKISEKIASLDATNLQQRMDLSYKPLELHTIATQFNSMLDRLEISFVKEQQFSSDVAHELRTPIAEILNIAEVALRWPNDEFDKKETFEDILGSAQRMQVVVNNLLALTQCDEGKISVDRKPINVVKNIEEALERFKPKAMEKKFLIERKYQNSVMLVTGSNEWDLMLNNIFSNIFEYGDNKYPVLIKIVEDKGDVIISFSNYAPSLEKNDLMFMTNRLWRKDRARSSSFHSGLGVPLILSYSKLLDLELALDLDGNNIFTVTLAYRK